MIFEIYCKFNFSSFFLEKISKFSEIFFLIFSLRNGGFGGDLNVDLLSDLGANISRDYGVLNDIGLALRGTFLIDSNQVLKHLSINDPDVGRNMDEYLRLVEAFNYAAEHGEVCPARWRKAGDATMHTDHSSEKTQDYWRNHLRED